jgi:hypothetical protein
VNKILVVILVTVLVVYLVRRMAQNRDGGRIKPPAGTGKGKGGGHGSLQGLWRQSATFRGDPEPGPHLLLR